jgi:hypothetical protein
VDGLLTRDFKNRWGATQVAAWLNEENPEVIKDAPLFFGASGVAGTANAFTIDGYDKIIAKPQDLLEVFRHHQNAAAGLLLGGSDQLDLWIADQSFAYKFNQIMDLPKMSPDEKSMRIQHVIDSSGPLYFQDVALTEASLAEMCVKSAGGDGPATDWLYRVATGKVLNVWGSLLVNSAPDSAHRLVSASAKILRWLDAAKTMVSSLKSNDYLEDYEKMHKSFVFLLFGAALSADEAISNGKDICTGVKEQYNNLGNHMSSAMRSDQLSKDCRTQVRMFNECFDTMCGLLDEAEENEENIPLFFAARILI